jgi:ATP-dependent DNA helicase RecQ
MFIENEYPPPDSVYRVYEFLRGLDADPIELTHAEIKEASRLDLNESAVGTTLKILEGAGAVERFRPRENMAIVRINAEGDEPSLEGRVNPNAHVQLVVLKGVEGLVNRRYGEPVYFQPDDFAARLGLDRSSLTRALKNLASDLPIDYVPPFRGNAVRVNDRSRRARDLVIDFEELGLRKKREYDKLERMIQYAQSGKCRRSYILGYFGDHDATVCGRCDNCGPLEGRTAPAQAVPIDNEAGREVVLKVLSGVARARGKFGKVAIAQMLIGSKSEKMTKLGLNRLSTFGILAEFGQAEVVALVDALALAGLVVSTEVDRFRPVVDLTERGREYLKAKGDAPLSLALAEELYTKARLGGLQRLSPRATPKPQPSPGRPADDDLPEIGPASPAPSEVSADPLTLRFKALRTQWAREAKVPPYTIFPDKTIEAIVRRRPSPRLRRKFGTKGRRRSRKQRF